VSLYEGVYSQKETGRDRKTRVAEVKFHYRCFVDEEEIAGWGIRGIASSGRLADATVFLRVSRDRVIKPDGGEKEEVIMEMFCRQCEQTAKGQACTTFGVCGKNPNVAALQDLLIYGLKSIAVYADMVRGFGVRDKKVDRFVMEGLFITVTNVNFDTQRIVEMIHRAYHIKEDMKKRYLKERRTRNGKDVSDPLPAIANWEPPGSLEALIEQGKMVGAVVNRGADRDIQSLREILLYGLKGMAAYADHASILRREDEEVSAFFYKGLHALVDDSLAATDLLGLITECGNVNLKCMEMLDRAHTDYFGHPEPTKVPLGVKTGPAIIVSGHDLYDLQQLLEQTQDKRINVYTHGEMLPAHGYPALKKYSHLVGHFGTAWQNQQKEFDGVPAAILMTTNCIQRPRESYSDRIFTTGLVGWTDVKHIERFYGKKDFSAVIKKARELGGFEQDVEDKEVTVGFAHHAVLNVADKIVSAVKDKKIRRFFLIGGCDGAKPGRNYYTEFAQKVPHDCIILTLACGKFRFNSLDFGHIGDFPRLLDCGQCNDAYSAITIASALAKAFRCTVNDLPLSFILSWYEQKAVVILLTLLSMGIKDIRLGPSLPAFISPDVLKILVDTFGIKPITSAEDDLKEILSGRAAAPSKK